MRADEILALLEMPGKCRTKFLTFLSLTGLVLAILFPVRANAAIIFTEVMYDYPGSEGSGDHDWVEVYNGGQSAVDLGGSSVRFMERGNNHLIASFGGSSTVLAPGAVAVIANNPSQVKLDFPGIELLLDSSFSLTGTTTALGIIIDGVNVSPVTYAPAAGASNLGDSLQLVSGSWVAAAPTPGTYGGASAPAADATPPAEKTPSGGASTEYIPTPRLRILADGDRTVSSGADTTFSAVVYDDKGNKRNESFVQWSFGDGMQRTGADVLHAYADPGEYLAVVHASTPDGGEARSEFIVTVRNAGIRIASVSVRGITLANDDTRTLDLSLWRLLRGGREFRIPSDTQILAGRTVLFPARIIDLPSGDSASLLYPSGEVAAVYPGTTISRMQDAQPSAPAERYERVQAVEPIINTRTDTRTYEEAVTAPREVTNSLTSRGAAMLTASAESAPAARTGPPSLLRSPWTLSFLGIMAVAGGAFILL